MVVISFFGVALANLAGKVVRALGSGLRDTDEDDIYFFRVTDGISLIIIGVGKLRSSVSVSMCMSDSLTNWIFHKGV